MKAITEGTRHALASSGELVMSPFIKAMSKEEVLETLPGAYDPGDGNPFRFFPGPSTANCLAARLSRAAFYWQIHPVDAVRALAKDGHRITDAHLLLWMRGEETLRPWEKHSIADLVHRLEQPESEDQVRDWWATTRANLARELEAFERRETRRQARARGRVDDPRETVATHA